MLSERDAREVEAHLADCAECAEYLAELRLVVAAMGDLPSFRVTGEATGTGCVLKNGGYSPAGENMYTAWLSPIDGKIRCRANNDPATESVAVTAITMPTISGTLSIGNSGACVFGFGPNMTDEVSFWDRALSDARREELLTTFAPF